MNIFSYEGLAKSSRSKLAHIFENGLTPTWEEVKGWEFRGWNVLPPVMWHFMWFREDLRFIKCFYERDTDEHKAWGLNLQTRAGAISDPWTCRPSDEEPGKIGHYRCFGTERNRVGDPHPHALYIEYDAEENTLLTGKGMIDYLVRVEEGNSDLYLGRAYTPFLGPIKLKSYFILERLQKFNR